MKDFKDLLTQAYKEGIPLCKFLIESKDHAAIKAFEHNYTDSSSHHSAASQSRGQ